MNRLMVNIDNSWEYVFCRIDNKRLPITTKEKQKAIHGDKMSLDYFTKMYSELQFKISK